MEIINFDSGSSRENKHHFLLPDCHYMIIGPTGCGKTNLLCNLLTRWMYADKITIYTINGEQEKYILLKEFFDVVGEETGENILEINKPEDVVSVDELDDEEEKVIVFDDIRIDKKNMDQIKEYFSLSRNKSCNCIYLTQSYYDVPKYIRRNTKCFCLYPNLDNKDVRFIANDHANTLTDDSLFDIYKQATNDQYNFFVIDKTSKHPPEMYRRNFDQFYF